ncbi:MAG: hypothetical protein KJ698_09105 [Actinobacteria bacterium]|nr:hypothetical protein [Actinomycetota bacterium]
MKKAVKKGFNPLTLGLVTDPVAVMAGATWYAGWKNIVAQDTSDWNICSRCMAQLKSYLSGKPKASGVTEATVATDQILGAMGGATPVKAKKWWQFWK